MADTKLSILIQLQDEASKALTEVGAKLKGLQSSMEPATSASKAFGIGLLAAGTAAAGFGIAAVKAAADAQAEIAKMDATLKNSKGNFEENRKAVLAAGEAAVKMGFDDEDAANSVAYLYQRTGDMTTAQKLNATAMDLARAKNIDLGTATTLVGQVLAGNGRILKQYGIDIKDTASPLEALGDLQDKVRGQASAFSQTFNGQMATFRVSWQNFMETVGDKLLPVVTQLLTKLNEFINNTLPAWIARTQEIIAWLDKHREILIIVAGAIAGALAPAILFSLIPALWGMITAFAAGAVALAPWVLGGMLIAGIVAGVLWVIQHWDLVKAKAAEVWDWIKDHLLLIGIALGPVGPLVVGIVKAADYIIKNWTSLKDTTEAVWNGIRDFFVNIWESIKSTFKSAIDSIMAMFQPLINAMNSVQNYKASGASLNPFSQSFKLPGFATGGIVTSPTVAMVGEAGPEAIIPLNQLGAAGGINIFISGNQIMSDSDAVRLGNLIVDRLRVVTKLGR